MLFGVVTHTVEEKYIFRFNHKINYYNILVDIVYIPIILQMRLHFNICGTYISTIIFIIIYKYLYKMLTSTMNAHFKLRLWQVYNHIR